MASRNIQWRPLSFGIALGIAALLLSVAPGDLRGDLHTHGRLHPWIHGVMFACFAALAMYSAAKASTRIVLLFAAFLLGVAIEYAESLRFHGPVERYDIRNDAIGVAAGALLYWLFTRCTR